MHIQVPIPGWLDSAIRLPDDSLLKAVHNAAVLREAKIKWAALGRDPKRLVTLYRHFGLDPAQPGSSWAQAVAHWRANFGKFIDGTWLTQHAPYVDLVEDCNEYTAVSTWADDPDHGASKLMSMEAAAWVWNNDYRGHGPIPAGCKFTLMCGPVANAFPRAVLELSVKYDAPINYHAYAQCLNGARVPGDFQDASGLADVLEHRYGIFDCEWVYGEVGPYKSSAEGWRAPGCLAGDQTKLVEVARAVQRDTQATRLFREGRLLGRNGYGAWFTSGGGTQWALYELEAAQLQALATMYREEALTAPPLEDPMDTQAIKAHAQAIIDLVDGKWWKTTPLPYIVLAVADPLVTYNAPNGTVHDSRPHVTYDLNVTAVDGDWLKVAPTPLWVKATDVKLKV